MRLCKLAASMTWPEEMFSCNQCRFTGRCQLKLPYPEPRTVLYCMYTLSWTCKTTLQTLALLNLQYKETSDNRANYLSCLNKESGGGCQWLTQHYSRPLEVGLVSFRSLHLTIVNRAWHKLLRGINAHAPSTELCRNLYCTTILFFLFTICPAAGICRGV